MNNDTFVVMYCNECIATFNNLEDAKQFIEDCKKSDLYIKKNQFSVHIKIYI